MEKRIATRVNDYMDNFRLGIKDYLENNYPLLKGGTFVIHTNKEGRIDEGASAKSQKELQQLRELANQVDSEDNNIKAIVSVLMLKEGWDVKNVTTVVGLRPFVASSQFLVSSTITNNRAFFPSFLCVS